MILYEYVANGVMNYIESILIDIAIAYFESSQEDYTIHTDLNAIQIPFKIIFNFFFGTYNSVCTYLESTIAQIYEMVTDFAMPTLDKDHANDMDSVRQ